MKKFALVLFGLKLKRIRAPALKSCKGPFSIIKVNGGR